MNTCYRPKEHMGKTGSYGNMLEAVPYLSDGKIPAEVGMVNKWAVRT